MTTHSHPITIIRQKYAKKIETLHSIFTNPKLCELIKASEDDEYKTPQHSINHFLEELDVYLINADMNKYQRAFQHYVCNLDNFNLRVFDSKRKQRVWNPLDQSFEDFCASVGDIDYVYANTPNPPTDIIYQWLIDDQ